jgi:hypothetical protein
MGTVRPAWDVVRAWVKVSRSALGRVSKQAALSQKRSGLTAGGHDSFAQPENQELGLWIIFAGSRFHLIQIMYGDHLLGALRTGGWHEPSISRDAMG